MPPNIENYLEKAEASLRKAEKFRKNAGASDSYLESIGERDVRQSLLLTGNYHATLANYYASRALIDLLSKKK